MNSDNSGLTFLVPPVSCMTLGKSFCHMCLSFSICTNSYLMQQKCRLTVQVGTYALDSRQFMLRKVTYDEKISLFVIKYRLGKSWTSSISVIHLAGPREYNLNNQHGETLAHWCSLVQWLVSFWGQMLLFCMLNISSLYCYNYKHWPAKDRQFLSC